MAEKIDITASDEYILTHRAIKARLKAWAIGEITGAHQNDMNAAIGADIPADTDGFKKAEFFYEDTSNAYVFSKADFDRFFSGTDIKDPGLVFTHCMIIVGALIRNRTNPITGVLERKRGKQTVLIAGCTPLTADPEKFVTTTDGTAGGPRLQDIAAEHPPVGYKVSILSPTFMRLTDEDVSGYNKVLITEKLSIDQ